MGHTEVAEAPGQGRDDGQEAVAPGGPGRGVVALGQVKVAGQRARVLHDRAHTAGLADAEENDDDQRDGHENALNQIGGTDGEEAAQHGVGNDDARADDHGRVVVPAKEAVEQRAHRLEAGGGIGDEEHHDHERRHQGQDVPLIAVAPGEIVGQRDGVQLHAVAPQALRHEQEVQVGSGGQADDGPARLGNARKVGQSGQAHQQIAAHIRRLGAHGCDQRAESPSAEIKLLRVLAASLAAEIYADEHHRDEIDHDGSDNAKLRYGHSCLPLFRLMRWSIAHVLLDRNREESINYNMKTAGSC